MDNKGGMVGGAFGGESGGMFGAYENQNQNNDFEQFAQSRGDLRPNLEKPMEAPMEQIPGAEVDNRQMEALPQVNQGMPSMPAVQPVNTEPVEEPLGIEDIPVSQGAEQLPPKYEKALVKVINENKKDPFTLSKKIDKARWDFMQKSFGRKMGDGYGGYGGR